ncbi:MAG: hypothetical protein IJN29_09620 [Akkermansia sp.]|nr:hypothetical protein [Akkermansia sp.]
MVYRTHKLSNGSIRKMSIRHGIIFWVLMVAVYYLMVMVESGKTLVDLNPWIVVALALPALGLAVLGIRRILKYRHQWEKLFFTLTEGGVLYESEQGSLSVFVPWSEVTMARRSGSVVHLYLKNGKAVPCFLEGVSEERRREFFIFALGHAGKGNSREITPPPADKMVENPLRYSCTKSQHREMCDAIEMVQAPGRVRVFRPILFAVWTLIFAVACYEAKFVLMGVSFLFLLSTAYNMWKPGARYARRNDAGGADIHVLESGYLLVRDSGLWLCSNGTKVTGAAALVYSDFYAFDNGGFLAVDKGQVRPAQWPEPCGRLPRRRAGWSMTMLVLLSLLVGVFSFTHSRLYHLYNAVNKSEPQRHIEYLAGVKPEDGCKVDIAHWFDDTRWLEQEDSRLPYAATIIVTYPDGRVKYLYLDARGRERFSEGPSFPDTFEYEGGTLYVNEDGKLEGCDIVEPAEE